MLALGVPITQLPAISGMSPFPRGERLLAICVCVCVVEFAVSACIFVTFALRYKSEEALVWVLPYICRLHIAFHSLRLQGFFIRERVSAASTYTHDDKQKKKMAQAIS